MGYFRVLQNTFLVTSATVFAGAQLVPGSDESGPVLTAAVSFVSGDTGSGPSDAPAKTATSKVTKLTAALGVFASAVRPLSHPRALEDAFRSYFAYRAAHPEAVKPYLYFVDYGQPSTSPRGYVFDMDAGKVVDGPFMVAHGRGSTEKQNGVPTRFSNKSGSAATSLGLFVAQELYSFGGKSAGQYYKSVGLRLSGVSTNFNDNARARGVVAHGAPYVSSSRAGHSEGCPAMEQARAKKLLPMLANGGLVFLFAPDSDWMRSDPWVAAAVN